MYRIISFFILFIVSTHIIYSQTTWENNWKKEGKREIMIHSIEYETNKLISVSVESDLNLEYTQKKNKSILRIHDIESGTIEKEVDYEIDSLSTTLSWVFYNSIDKKFIVAGETHSTSLPLRRGYFLVTTWDNNLNFISDTIINLEPMNEGNVLWYIMGHKKSEDEFIITGKFNNDIENLTKNTKLLLIKINKDGQIIVNKWIKRLSPYSSSIFFDHVLDRYVLFSAMTYYLNSDLSVVDSLHSYDAGDYYSGVAGKYSYLADNKYLISARYEAGYERGLALFDRNLKFLKGIKAEIQEWDFNFPFGRQNFDYIDTSKIYFGVQNSNLTYYSVGKVNSNLDPYWIKYFSLNDSDRHYVFSITATQDGGCVIVGSKGQDFNNGQPNDLSAWAIKLDANGNTVSTQDPGSDAWEITVFPNPSAGDFRIEIAGSPAGNELLLYDLQGREVKKYQNLTEGTNTFMFDDLPQGTYIWKLMNKGKEIGEGKWVKVGE